MVLPLFATRFADYAGGHPSLFHTTTSFLIWYKMTYIIQTYMDGIYKDVSVYAQSGTHSRFTLWIIVVLTYNPSVLMCVEITDAPKL